jgi:hypothetical protein
MKTLAGQIIEFQNETFTSTVGSTDSGVTICSSGSIRNHTIVLKGPIGNLPSFTLVSSAVSDGSLTVYTAPDDTSDPSTRILQLYTLDGREEGVKVCNGLGHCNNKTGKCECAYVSPPPLPTPSPQLHLLSRAGNCILRLDSAVS